MKTEVTNGAIILCLALSLLISTLFFSFCLNVSKENTPVKPEEDVHQAWLPDAEESTAGVLWQI